MPNSLEIQDLSTKSTLPEGYVCAEKKHYSTCSSGFCF